MTRLLHELSPDSAIRRFQTVLGPEPAACLVDALLPDTGRGGAVLALLGEQVVAHGMWARTGATPAAELGIVVADAHQGRGIGTAIVIALVADLTARGIDEVEVFASLSNRAVVRMVQRQAPFAGREQAGAMITYRCPTPPLHAASTVA